MTPAEFRARWVSPSPSARGGIDARRPIALKFSPPAVPDLIPRHIFKEKGIAPPRIPRHGLAIWLRRLAICVSLLAIGIGAAKVMEKMFEYAPNYISKYFASTD